LEVNAVPTGIYRRQDAAGQAKYQSVKELARRQDRILSGTPGTLKQRTQSGNKYWVREYIRVDASKTDEYIGPAKSVDAEEITNWTDRINLARTLAAASASLRLFGYQRIDRKPAAVMGVFFNRQLIQGGLILVGSHAYGALLNELGILAPGYKTADIDVARARRLAIALPDGLGLQGVLKETGMNFVPVPGMPSRRPSASFMLPGADPIAVDLLVPGKQAGDIIPVDELATYAQSIPLLDYLIEDPIESIVLSPNQVVPVRVPSPENFALHKLFSSQSRRSNRDKIRKDLEQAAVLAAALEEETPGRLMDASRKIPREGRAVLKRGAAAAAKLLAAHPDARESLTRLAGGRV
jgi:hypothetical protein